MNSLLNKYKEFLLIPESPRAFLMTGATEAANWIDQLNDDDFLELKNQLLNYIEAGTNADLINLIFVTKLCNKRDLKLIVKDLIHRGYGKDCEDVKIYFDSFFNPMKEGTGVQIESKWGMHTNKQVRGKKKKRGAKD